MGGRGNVPRVPEDPEITLSQAEAVCLAVVAAGATHGWAVVRELKPAAALGAVWSLSRQLTYRALEQLTAKALLNQTGHQPGRGRGRLLLGVTPAGREALSRWLDTPAAHIRDVRCETLLKLMLRERLGLDNAAFLQRQRAALNDVIQARLRPSGEPANYAELLRREQAAATKRFLDRALSAAGPPTSASAPIERGTPPLLPGSSLTAVVTHLVRGEALATIRLRLPEAQTVTTVVLDEDVDRLGLLLGGSVQVSLKATEILVVGVLAS